MTTEEKAKEKLYICFMKNYFSIHKWLKDNHGKASKCENELCEYENPKRYEWALLKGKHHAPNRNNYIQLCPSCHRKYDMTDAIRNNMSNSKKGIIPSNKGKDSRIIIECEWCKKQVKRYSYSYKKAAFCSHSCASKYRESNKKGVKNGQQK